MIAALYVRHDTVYRSLGLDCWDRPRDAKLYDGPGAVVAHPPCGPYGTHAATCYQDPTCAPRAVEQVRAYGGCLEHPKFSTLWKLPLQLPYPGFGVDPWVGFTIQLDQCRFGHRALKPTWVYVVGIDPKDVPELPPWRAPVRSLVGMCEKEREATPPAFARYLVSIARAARSPQG